MEATTFINSLKRCIRLDKTLDLLNVYKGVPVLYKAGVTRFTQEQVYLSFEQPEAICMMVEKQVVIMNATLDEPIVASVLAVDLTNGSALLSELRYAGGHLGDRLIMRVEPRGIIEAKLECGDRQLNARVVDLSINGLGLLVAPRDADGLRPMAGARAEVLLTPEFNLRLTGTVRYVKEDAEMYRAGLNFVSSQTGELLRYIQQRHTEILAEIHQLFQAAIQRARASISANVSAAAAPRPPVAKGPDTFD